MQYLLAIISVIVISLISLVGVFTLSIKHKSLERLLLTLVAFSVGALLGDAFIHLLPEAVADAGGFNLKISTMLILGILLFFGLEKFLRWRHCHDEDCNEHPHHLGTMNLVGDAVHNFIDGVLIGASYLVSIPLGVATTIAVVAHEVPQELGDFGVLLHSGMSKKQALLFNFYSACTAIVGVIFVLLIGTKLENTVSVLVPLTAGGFIYIAMSDLIPELHKDNQKRSFVDHFLAIFVGVVIMYLLLFVS